MCGIERKRCSSRPSHDTCTCRSCSQVTWSILLCCHLWVALVLSWCRGGQTRLPSSLLRLLGSSCGASRSLPLAGHYPSGNHGLRGLLDRSENDNLLLPCAGIVKDPSVVFRRIVLILTLYLSVSQRGSTTLLNRNRGAHAGEYTHVNLLHERI